MAPPNENAVCLEIQSVLRSCTICLTPCVRKEVELRNSLLHYIIKLEDVAKDAVAEIH